VDIMPSLQRPKKLVFHGTDGKKYPFLCKPHDDLRKDARLMDFNAMINKLLKSASESRRRQLCEFFSTVIHRSGTRGEADYRYPYIRSHAVERRMWSFGMGSEYPCTQEYPRKGIQQAK